MPARAKSEGLSGFEGKKQTMKQIRLNVKKRELRFGAETLALPEAPAVRKIRNEGYENLPSFDEHAVRWQSGRRLLALQAYECTMPGVLVPGSVRVTAHGKVMTPGKDFQVNETWGTVARIESGRILPKEQVRVSYSCYVSRIDAVIRTEKGLAVVRGREDIVYPAVPRIPKGSVRLANLYWHGDCSTLTEELVYPVTETEFPADLIPVACRPERIIRKLKEGKPVRILAWGDSVTECSYLPSECRWQNQFLRRLRKKYPRAKIELLTEGWGGHTAFAFLQVPASEPHNFEEKVLRVEPDLIISEFVNDASRPEKEWKNSYPKALKAFRKIGAEWIILTPHYTCPAWIGLPCSRNCDDDPRHFVKYLRTFSEKEKIPLADASRYWGRLYRQGIPYETLYSNGINHPLEYGLSLFAEALMKLF